MRLCRTNSRTYIIYIYMYGKYMRACVLVWVYATLNIASVWHHGTCTHTALCSGNIKMRSTWHRAILYCFFLFYFCKNCLSFVAGAAAFGSPPLGLVQLSLVSRQKHAVTSRSHLHLCRCVSLWMHMCMCVRVHRKMAMKMCAKPLLIWKFFMTIKTIHFCGDDDKRQTNGECCRYFQQTSRVLQLKLLCNSRTFSLHCFHFWGY